MSAEPGEGDEDRHPFIDPALRAAFPAGGWQAGVLSDANEGRGVFSRVTRVELAWTADPTGPDGARPASVVVKSPADGDNGAAAIASGACVREALAYRTILGRSPVDAPRAFAVVGGAQAATFVLEDLARHRAVDQLTGLGRADALAVTTALARLHAHWSSAPDLDELDVRRSTPSKLDPAALRAGLATLVDRWADVIDDDTRRAFEDLVANRAPLVDAFTSAGPMTLCHGDPRADNLVFADDGRPVLYDWQQLAIQFGAADLAWLAATSLTPRDRRDLDAELVAAYGTTQDHYRLGFVLPGLAVLLLAQRQTDDERARRFVTTSLTRIGSALLDLDVAGAA